MASSQAFWQRHGESHGVITTGLYLLQFRVFCERPARSHDILQHSCRMEGFHTVDAVSEGGKILKALAEDLEKQLSF